MPSYKFDIAPNTIYEGTSANDAKRLRGLNTLRSLPETPWDLGFIRLDTPVVFYVYNGLAVDLSFTGYTAVDASGISAVLPEAFNYPVTIQPGHSEKFELLITLEGPTQFNSLFTLETDQGDMLLRIYGIRAPFLSGNLATLLWPHNWVSGLNQSMSWLTEVLTAYDGSEQRISLRTLPRRSYQLNYLVENEDIELLGTYLGARRVDFFYIPSWHDVGATESSNLEGDTSLLVDTVGRDYEADQKVIIWSDRDTYDEGTVASKTDFAVTLIEGLNNDYPKGTKIVPVHPYYLDSPISVKKHINSAVGYTCTMSAVYDMENLPTYTPTIFEGYELFPLDLNFTVTDDSIDHKWEFLDNSVGLPTVVRETIDPINTMQLEALLLQRADVTTFKEFLHVIKGQLLPFWLLSKVIAFIPTQNLVNTQASLTISFCSYTIASYGERGKGYIQIILKDGSTANYKIIDAEFDPVTPDVETLTVTPAFDADVLLEDIAEIRYLQLVRFGTDTFNLEWLTEGRLRCKFPVNILV